VILDVLVLKYSGFLLSNLCKNAAYYEETEQKTRSRPGWIELWRREDTGAWREK